MPSSAPRPVREEHPEHVRLAFRKEDHEKGNGEIAVVLNPGGHGEAAPSAPLAQTDEATDQPRASQPDHDDEKAQTDRGKDHVDLAQFLGPQNLVEDEGGIEHVDHQACEAPGPFAES